MRYLILIPIIIALLSSCASHSIQTEFSFANQMAKGGLWKEALFRWQKLLTDKKESAALHNNIAVALEQMGRVEEAKKEYQLALKLAPRNDYIQKNYERFQENQKEPDEKEEPKKKSGKNKKRKWKNEN